MPRGDKVRTETNIPHLQVGKRFLPKSGNIGKVFRQRKCVVDEDIKEGRLNDIIKTGGANVSPVEIDEVIQACPGVKLSQTVGVPDEMLGEMVVTCIILQADAPTGEATIRDFAKHRLASFKVPRRVLFFGESDLQLTGRDRVA